MPNEGMCEGVAAEEGMNEAKTTIDATVGSCVQAPGQLAM